MSYLSLRFWETDVNIADNYSTLHVEVAAHLDPGWHAYNGYATMVYFNCAGQNGAITVPSYNIPTGGAKILGTARFIIGHNNDGSYYDGTCTASWDTGTIGTLTGSGKFALTLIPRATQPNVAYNDGSHRMGTIMIINLPAASSSFTHNVYYGFGNTSGPVANDVKGSVNWMIPKDLAFQIPSSLTGQGSIGVDTYNGSIYIGTKNCTFTIMVSDGMIPTFSSLTMERVDNGVPSSFGLYVQGITKIKLTANNGQGSYGSSVVSCAISGAGFNYGGSPATFGPFTVPDTMIFSATVKDSRGRTASKSVSIIVYEYKPPTLTFTAQRCTSSGLVSETGTYVLVKPVYSYSSVNGKNNIASKSFSVNGSSNTTVSNGGSCIIGAGTVAINKQWEVTGNVTDAIGNKAQIIVKIGTSEVPFNIRADGKGVSFGKYSEIENRLESVWPINAPEMTLTDKLDVGKGGIDTNGTVSSAGGMRTTNGTTIKDGSLELYYTTPFIDFHYANTVADYSSRLIALNGHTLNFQHSNGSGGAVHFEGAIIVEADIWGKSAKARAVSTDDYGIVTLNAVESGSALFQDYGSGIFDEQGVCIIYHDPVFLETVNSKIKYNVQLTKCYKGGDIWFNERDSTSEYMIVNGEPNKSFKWVVTMKQRGYEDKCFDTVYEVDMSPRTQFSDTEDLAKKELELYEKEIEDEIDSLINYAEGLTKESYNV